MSKTPKYVKEVQHILANFHENGDGDTPPFDTTPPENEIDMYVEEDRITLIPRRLHGMPVNEQEIIDSILSDLDTTPLPTKLPVQPKPPIEPASNAIIGVLLLGMFLPIFCIAVQLYCILNPFTVTITMLAKSQQVSLQGSLQLGRVLNPITVSQSATAPTTGHGHQDARSATGNVRFYNGQQTQQTIPQGTVFTGSDGVSIETTQDATIPPGNPNTGYGTVTVSAQAVQAGSKGNIQAGDVNIPIAIAVFVKNDQFSGGQDERDFRTVSKNDITNAAAPLKTTLDNSMQDTLSGQLKSGEALTSQHCTQTTTTDHQAGQEATTVKVTVSETCSAVVYNQDTLQANVTQLLTTQATRKFAGYSMLGYPQVDITQAATQNTNVMLSFKAQSTWIYALGRQEQQHIKQILAGKNTAKVLQVLRSLPGIERVSLNFVGFGDVTRIPKTISNIHLLIFYGL